MKINCNDGTHVWTRFLKSNLGNYIYSMLTDNLGILYLLGSATANNPLSLTFNNTSYSKSGGQDAFLLKLNNDSGGKYSVFIYILYKEIYYKLIYNIL
jgi:hypothetical protein